MSELPPGPPISQVPAYAVPGPSRPTSVTVLSIIVLVIEGIKVLCMPVQLFQLFVTLPATAGNSANVMLDLLRDNTVIRIWSIISSFAAVVLALAFMAAAANALRLRPSGRVWMVRLSVIQLLFYLAGLGMLIFFIMPPLMNVIHNASTPPERIGATVGLVAALLGPFLHAILPGVVLYFFQTPYVIDTFEGKSESSAWQLPSQEI